MDFPPAAGPAAHRARRPGRRRRRRARRPPGARPHALRSLAQDIGQRLKPPGWTNPEGRTHWLGTDHLGRDILGRILYGSRIALVVGLSAVAIAGTLGLIVGVVSGYFGGLVDDLFMRLADIQLAFPFILLALAVIGVSARASATSSSSSASRAGWSTRGSSGAGGALAPGARVRPGRAGGGQPPRPASSCAIWCRTPSRHGWSSRRSTWRG